MTAEVIYRMIDELAPFALQESYDNAGLSVGDPDAELTGMLFALDVTQRVIDEAVAAHANLIVTHHPLMFSAIHRIREDDSEGRLLSRLIREKLTVISAHTNLDRAPEGVSMTLARVCGLKDIEGDSFLRTGNLPGPVSAADLAVRLSGVLGDVVRLMGDPDKTVRRLAVVSGAGSECWQEAFENGADAFLTGEVKHHHALAAADAGMVVLEAGHFATEQPGIFALADTLQSRLNAIKCSVPIVKSKAGRYAFPAEIPGK